MKEDYGKHAQEPVWLGCKHLRRQTVPETWRHWLLDHSSLTRRLQRTCGSDFRVEVVSLAMETPMLSEARALGRPQREIALVRQVYLLCGNTPWVFARPVIPLPSLNRGLRRLTELGSKPLGAVLFADPRMQRAPLEVAKITPRHRLHRMSHGKGPADDALIWGRRSVFSLRGNPLLVSEFFLPDLLLHDRGETC